MRIRPLTGVALAALILLMPLVASVPLASALSFAARSDLPTAYGPCGLVIDDFNGDGRPDIATSDMNNVTVSVLLSNAGGGFDPKTDYPTGLLPVAIAMADFNGDRAQDLVTPNVIDDTVSVLCGDGHGGFGVKTDYAVGGEPTSVAVGDFNDDGHADVATGNQSSNNVSILLGDGHGSFASTTAFPAGYSPQGVAIGDFNGDGKQDLAVANWGDNTVGILLGDGNGSFGAMVPYGTGASSAPRRLAVADFNGDGKQDLAVADQGLPGSFVSVLLGDGNGGLGTHTDFTVGAQPMALAAGDIDGDGNEDLAVANVSSDTVSVLLGDGTGSFAPKMDLATGDGPVGVTISDLNGDGRKDVAVTAQSASTVNILPNAMPVAHMRIDGGAAATSSATVTIDSSNALDVTEMRVRDAGGTWGVWEAYAAQTSWTLPAGDGTKTVEVQYRNAIDQSLTYAGAILLDTTAPTTTNDAPSGWQRGSAVTVTLTPSDSGSGMSGGLAKTEYKLDGAASWSSGTQVTVSGDGVHALSYRSTDAVGNVGAVATCSVSIDTTAPTTTAAGVPAGWVKGPVTVIFSASDNAGGSGAAFTEYSLDGAAFARGEYVTVSGNAQHTLAFRSADNASNLEAAKTTLVRIDAVGPSTLALAKVTVKKGKKASFRFKISDVTPTAKVTIKIFKKTRLKKILSVGSKVTNTALAHKWTCKLARGSYTWKVYTTDLAGNRQRVIGKNILVVR